MYEGTSEKTCTQCGATFRGGTNKTCNPCRTTERQCVTCGKTFHGRERECYECKATDRPCKVCGEIFHDVKRTCQRCREQTGTCQMMGCTEPKLRGQGHRYCDRHYVEGPLRERAQILRRARERTYGITHAKFLAMLEAQNGVCAICGNGNDGTRQLGVDHDHETGAVRELLCNRCNPMLGYARDSIPVLQAAIAYLKRHMGND